MYNFSLHLLNNPLPPKKYPAEENIEEGQRKKEKKGSRNREAQINEKKSIHYVCIRNVDHPPTGDLDWHGKHGVCVGEFEWTSTSLSSAEGRGGKARTVALRTRLGSL